MLVQLADAGGEELDASGDVALVTGFDGLVDVACGDGDRACDGATCNHALQAGCVGTPCCEDFRLPLDFMVLRRVFHELHHAIIADHGRIHELDSGSFSKGSAAFFWL